MGQVRHGCATTTHAIRAAIQRSQASIAALSQEFGINPKTVAKWRKRETGECPELCVSGPAHAVWDTQASKRSPNIMAN
ncbi:helix-turn-helix domain-containing protein [Ferrimonas balearica]|nr:helix-turn-helix domain-containing protein [Ferrimonas balearica]